MLKKRLPRRCIQRAYMTIKYLPHNCIQRVFFRWYNENSTRFQIPLHVTRITAKGLEFHFQNYPECLSVWVENDRLCVHVEWQGEPWDVIFDTDLYPCQTPDGFKCKLCESDEDESATLFPTREALWQDHLFDPFLKWVNEKLAPASWLKISCTNDKGCTWAQLVLDESKLSEPDRTLFFLQQLKRLDGKPCVEEGPDGVTN